MNTPEITQHLQAIPYLRSHAHDVWLLLESVASQRIATCISALLVLAVASLWWLNSRKRNIPTLSSLTMIRDRKELNVTKFHLYLTEMGKRFKGIFSVGNMIFVDNKDLAHDLYIKQDPTFAGKPEEKFYTLHEFLFKSEDIANRSYDEKLRFLRKQAFQALHMHGAGLVHFELIVREELNELSQQLEASAQQDVDPAPLLYAAIANIIATLLFGEKFDYNSQEVQVLSDLNKNFQSLQCVADVPELDNNRWAKYLLRLPIRRYERKAKQLKTAIDVRDHVFANIIQKHRAAFDGKHSRSALDQLLLSQQQHGSDVFTDQMLQAVLLDLVIAGTLTTYSTTTGLILTLATLQQVQQRAQKEVDDVIGDSRAPCSEDKEHMPYVGAMILEQLRFQTIAPLGVMRTAIEDTKLGSCNIRKGDCVTVNQFAIHHDPQHWRNPDEFDPHNFLDASGQLLPTDQYKSKGFIPFGAGRRACLGESLAKSRLFLMTATVLQRFHILPPEGEKLPKLDSNLFEFRGTCQPPSYKVRFVSRN